MPAFEGSDGTLLTESNAIAYYVANEELRGGSDAAARAEVSLALIKGVYSSCKVYKVCGEEYCLYVAWASELITKGGRN